MDFSAGLRRRLSRTVRTLEGARISPGNLENRLAGKHMATRQHLGWILSRALLPGHWAGKSAVEYELLA